MIAQRSAPPPLCPSFLAFLSLETKGINFSHRCSACRKQASSEEEPLCFPKRLPEQAAQNWQEVDRPTPRWRLQRLPGVKVAARGHACALGSPPLGSAGRGWGRDAGCCAPVVFHRGGCRRGSLSRAMLLLCWWQVLLWVLGLPARGLEGECGPGGRRRLREAPRWPPRGAGRWVAVRGGAGLGRCPRHPLRCALITNHHNRQTPYSFFGVA